MPDTGAADPAALLQLATWLSPAFPVGAFAWSHGVEAAVAAGDLPDADAVFDWIATLMEAGSGWNDLVLLAAAYRAFDDRAALAAVAELAEALAGTRERRAETLALGAAFAAAAGPWGPVGAAPYPVAVAALARRCGVPLRAGLVAYANAFASSLVSAATRLVPLGQSAAVATLARLHPLILAVAERAATSTLDDAGQAAFLSDIAAMRHETLPTRLFRS